MTRKLLTEKNRFRILIMKHAYERHIPILPLMMEKSLGDVFSKIFRDLWYPRPNSDDTAISFEEKPEKYLNGILIGNETVQSERDALNRNIFSSKFYCL